MSAIEKKPSLSFIFCIENEEFRKYLEVSTEDLSGKVKFLTIEHVPRTISENTEATLVLQSDKNEGIFFDIGKKLKGVFFKDLRIIFLSFDYLIKADALKGFSSFLQVPCTFEAILNEAKRLSDTKKKILLIDDSKLVHKNLVGPLKEKGFLVEQAFDGKQGLATAISAKPDLIICDIEMPVMNGFEACASIRAHEDTKDTYIIMSSTLRSAEDQKKGFAAGVDEYMPKPVIFDDLLERIKRAFTLESSLREKVLIIDQNSAQAETIANFLNKQGFASKVVASISEARRLLKKISSDLILSETNPTDGSIIDVSQLCEADFTNSDLAFIGLVNQDNEADRRMALNAGAKDTVATPMTGESLAAVVERTVAELRSERERNQFQKYVSKASFQSALEKSVLSELPVSSRAERRTAIVFFLDIAKFTGRCERYSPEEIVSQINNMFEKITEVITEEGGDIDKFMGDACMSFWFDEGQNNSHEKCISAVLKIQKAMEELNESDETLKKDPLKIRMGLNSGEVILCDLGASKARVDLTMIGDAVNIAARLETACSKYGIDNLISGSIAEDARNIFTLRLIDKIHVYGKSAPVSCYEAINRLKDSSNNEKTLATTFENAFNKYEIGKFVEAKDLFVETSKIEPDREASYNPSVEYIKRCEYLISNPPQEWDGTWKLDSK
jgi:DNA-binding response OmpR family regulator